MENCKVISVDKNGAVFMIGGEKREISFAECAKNFKLVSGGSGRSVGSRDIRKCRFVFYSEPRTVVAFEGLFRVQKFNKLENLIRKNGYKTFDIS